MTEWLSGKKSYIIAACVGLVVAARFLNLLDETTYQVLLGLLGAGGIASLRAGITKSGV